MAQKNSAKAPGDENLEKKKAPPKGIGDKEETPAAEHVQAGDELALQLEGLREENAALAERNLRLMAEFDNYRKRTQRERESIYPDAMASALTALLPLLDNFQRALETPCSDESYQKGVQLIYTSLWETMVGLGVEVIGEAGEPFDPNLHNAVMHVDDEDLEKNVVAQVFQKGYKIGDRVLRHAMVQVAN